MGNCPSPSQTSYCCSSQQNQFGEPFKIRRHDTCPSLEIDVRDGNGNPVDLTDWTATGVLFYRAELYADIDDVVTDIPLSRVASARIGDEARIESQDYDHEKLLITAIDRPNAVLTVDRGHDGTTPVAHLSGARVIGIRSTDIPIEIEMFYSESSGDIAVPIDSEDEEEDIEILSKTKLTVKWRETDTQMAGAYLLEVKLLGPDGQKLTLPRTKPGYPIMIMIDSDNI